MSYDVPSPVDEDLEPDDRGDRWSWVFWVLLGTAALPLFLAVASVQHLRADASVMAPYLAGPGYPSAVFSDRWELVESLSTVGSAGPLTAVAVVVLAGVVASRRPGWLVAPGARWAVAALGLACALWTAATATLSAWAALGEPTARELAEAQDGSPPTTWVDWAPGAAPQLFAVVLALAAVVLCVVSRGPGRSRPVDSPDPPRWPDE